MGFLIGNIRKLSFSIILIMLSLESTKAADVEGWRSRIVYQVMTDRYATTGEHPDEECSDLTTWCNGTWRGIADNLDYIQNLGADAIWISPIVLNLPGNYHAYAALNIYEMEPHFGTEEDLHYLVQQAHERDMWIMVDVVPNHMGRQDGCNDTGCYPDDVVFDFTKFTPFNESEHYHEFCMWSGDNDAQEEMEICRIFNLPDLNQTHPWVRKTLLDWITNLTREYDIDGYRIDTTRHIGMEFWPDYQEAAEAFCIGEVWNEQDVPYVAGYQNEGELDSVFQFPLHHAINQVFRDGESFSVMADVLAESREHFRDLGALGLFVDNHDMARFLHNTADTAKFRNALTFVMFAEGIPFIYYGSEQGFNGGPDPNCRESLWPHYDQDHPLYKFIKASLEFRKQRQEDIIGSSQSEILVQDNAIVFSRGNSHQVLIALTNVGENNSIAVTIASLDVPDDTVYVNIMDEDDEVVVKNGAVDMSLPGGEPKVYSQKTLGPTPPGDGAVANYGGWLWMLSMAFICL